MDSLDVIEKYIWSVYKAEVTAAETKRANSLSQIKALYASISPNETAQEGPTLKTAVQNAVNDFVGEFSREDVTRFIEARYPRLMPRKRQPTLASMLSRLNGHKIETAHRGGGRTLRLYRKFTPLSSAPAHARSPE